MENVVWEMTHSVETDADVEFAWRYWSDVGNWDDPPATFELEGAFERDDADSGATGNCMVCARGEGGRDGHN